MHSTLQLIDPKEIGFSFEFVEQSFIIITLSGIVAHFTDLQKLVYIVVRRDINSR